VKKGPWIIRGLFILSFTNILQSTLRIYSKSVAPVSLPMSGQPQGKRAFPISEKAPCITCTKKFFYLPKHFPLFEDIKNRKHYGKDKPVDIKMNH